MDLLAKRLLGRLSALKIIESLEHFEGKLVIKEGEKSLL